MKIARTYFKHPSGQWIKKEAKQTSGFWTRVTTTIWVDEWVAFTKDSILEQAKEFIDKIGPDRVVNISEYTTAKNVCGDDGNWYIVVWYWDDENSDSGEVQRGRDVAEQSPRGCCQGGNTEGCGPA